MQKLKKWWQKKSKKVKITFFASFIIVLITPLLITFIIMKSNNDKEKEDKISSNFFENELTADDIFPEVSYRDYYHLIEIENQKPKIGEKMISYFIKDVTSKLGVSYGDIHFNYWIKNNQSVYIEFRWVNDEQIISKNYHLNLDTNI